MAWKLEETRKYYAMYNALDTSLTYLQKNVKILDSITTTFDEAMGNAIRGKEEFMTSMNNIMRGLDVSIEGQEEKLAVKESQLEEEDLSPKTH